MDRLFAVAQGVAPLLTGQWRYNQRAAVQSAVRQGNRAVLNDDTQPGRHIVLRPAWQRPGRIEVFGMLPTDYPSQTRITVAETRPIAALAGEINRRLLPRFLTEWTAAEERRQQQAAAMDLYRHQVELLQTFVPAFGPSPNRDRLTGADTFSFRDGRVQLFSSGVKASLRLSLAFDDVVRVLMTLYGERNQKKEEA